MIFRRLLGLLVFPLCFCQAGVIPADRLVLATGIASSDGVGPGFCGRGVWSVLGSIGYGNGLRSADGQDWEGVLQRAGWRPVFCPSPVSAPLGSVLVYTSDFRLHGKNLIGTAGGRCGHVELVALNSAGGRVYVSDAARENPGGTVPFNFTRRAWVPPGSVAGVSGPLRVAAYDPAKLAAQVDELMEERQALARVFFSRRQVVGLALRGE